MKRINNSGKQGKWIKSVIPNEDYICSLCGGGCWYYDYQQTVKESNFCPNCGAQMYDDPDEDFIETRFRKCSQELIDIAKASRTPSEILRIVGDNFINLSKGFEKIENEKQSVLDLIENMERGESNEPDD